MSNDRHISYYSMGQWPIYVGFTMSPKAFRREMKRLNVSPAPAFVTNDHSHATTHFLTKDGGTTCIITMRKPGDRPVEQVAGLLAHEAMHVVQELWENIGETQPGKEAEAYLIQMITQSCLQDALKTGRTRSEAP